MLLLKNYYSPLDVAIHWSHLAPYASEILQTAVEHPRRLRVSSPQWPLLEFYVERICDAIMCNELPARYLGQLLTFPSPVQPLDTCLRSSDLRWWVLRYHPHDKPDFLFEAGDHSGCIELGVYLALQARLESSTHENDRLREQNVVLTSQLDAKSKELSNLTGDVLGVSTPAGDHNSTLLGVLGAVLSVTVGNSENGQPLSVHRSHAALVDAITNRFPGVAGLRKHTLDRKFAAARQRLAQVL